VGAQGSSRWGITLTRATTEGLPRLDVRALARAGALESGESATIDWGGTASISTDLSDDSVDAVTIRYRVHRGTASRLTIEERISLPRTTCTFGGTRVWFSCPRCGTRRAVLYALGGRFRCRSCHQLAYASTRARR
jgi:predicted RNA-binding Zn-ribbon protein involved in translation (DUF1610 family)